MYEEYNDNELLSMINESGEDVKDILFQKYKYIIDIEVKKYLNMAKLLGYDYKDLYQDGLVGFADALNSYREDKNTKISSFITLCVDRRLNVAITKAGRIKNKLNADSLSLEQTYNDSSQPLMDILSDNKKNDPLENILKEENLKELMFDIKKELSPKEYDVYNLMLNGLKYNQIATILNKTPKQVDNSIQRIKQKIKKIINNRVK